MAFIEKRYFALKDELLARGVNITPKDSIVDFRASIPLVFYQDFHPSPDELCLSIERIIEKINAKPNWYRRKGVVIDDEGYVQRLETATIKI